VHLRDVALPWVTATVASKIDANTFTLQYLPGMFGGAGFSTMQVNTSAQTEFANILQRDSSECWRYRFHSGPAHSYDVWHANPGREQGAETLIGSRTIDSSVAI